MKVIQTGLLYVLKRFPEHKDAVKLLFRESESFQTMCEDYRKCAEALQYWNQSYSEEASLLRDEYSTLLQGLDAEILRCLTIPNLQKSNINNYHRDL